MTERAGGSTGWESAGWLASSGNWDAAGYDLTIDLQGLLRSALMAAATGAKVRVGMADAREGARWFYTHHVDAPRLGLHAVERVLRVAAEFGADRFPSLDSTSRSRKRIVAGRPKSSPRCRDPGSS